MPCATAALPPYGSAGIRGRARLSPVEKHNPPSHARFYRTATQCQHRTPQFIYANATRSDSWRIADRRDDLPEVTSESRLLRQVAERAAVLAVPSRVTAKALHPDELERGQMRRALHVL
jgi:hypothetical protein